MRLDEHAFPWERLKGGFTGFEDLALDYINQHVHPEDGREWEPTSRTRDGNKDAVVIFSFSSTRESAQWWMEAKYSTKKNHLERYRIDSTIVSALINRTVKRLYFVTNTIVSTKTELDIKQSLSLTACEKVVFYSKTDLERWLLDDYDTFRSYISSEGLGKGGLANLFEALERPEIALESKSLRIYSTRTRFAEPTCTLFEGEPYWAVLDIYSSRERPVRIQIANEGPIRMRDEEASRSTTRLLEQGSNPLKIGIQLERAERARGFLAFEVTGQNEDLARLSCSTDRELGFAGEGNRLEIGFQRKVIQRCEEHEWGQRWTSLVLEGPLGVGKSSALDQASVCFDRSSTNVFRYCFCGDQYANAQTMRSVVIDLILPFCSSEDRRQLDEYGSASPIVSRIADADREASLEAFLGLFRPEVAHSFVVDAKSSVPRVLMFDDIDLLCQELQEFLFSFLSAMRRRGYRAFCILSGEDHASWSGVESYRNECEVDFLQCRIAWDDVATCFEARGIAIDQSCIDVHFDSLVLLKFFCEYLVSEETCLHSGDFQKMLLLFRGSPAFSSYVKERFQRKVFSGSNLSERARDLFRFVYYCPAHIGRERCMKALPEETSQLFDTGLVKSDASDCLVPVHESYVEVFQENYCLTRGALLIAEEVSPLASHMMELADYGFTAPDELVGRLNELFYQQRFHSLYYVLEPYLTDEKKARRLRATLFDERYLTLRWLYVHAEGNVSRKRSSRADYLSLLKDIEKTTSSSATICALEFLSLFEIVNAQYEHSAYEEAPEFEERLARVRRKLEGLDDYAYQDLVRQRIPAVPSLVLLLADARGEAVGEGLCAYVGELEQEGLFPPYAFEVLRVAMTQLTKCPDYAEMLVRRCHEQSAPLAQNNPKAARMCAFARLFVAYARRREGSLLAIEAANEELRSDFRNDYNRHLPVLAVANLMEGDVARARGLLAISDDVARTRAPRQQEAVKLVRGLLSALDGDLETAVRIHGESLGNPILPSDYQAAPKHNAEMLESGECPKGIAFYCGQKMDRRTLYYDIRFMF